MTVELLLDSQYKQNEHNELKNEIEEEKTIVNAPEKEYICSIEMDLESNNQKIQNQVYINIDPKADMSRNKRSTLDQNYS